MDLSLTCIIALEAIIDSMTFSEQDLIESAFKCALSLLLNSLKHAARTANPFSPSVCHGPAATVDLSVPTAI